MASIKQLMTLLGKAGIKEDLKRQMLFNLTGGRTTSVRELSQKELDIICNNLSHTTNQAENELLMRNKRSIVLKLATSTGIKEPDSWTKFNGWMLKFSVLKKELHAYNLDELDQLTRQFRALESNYKASAKKPGTKAWFRATGIPEISCN